MKDEKETAARKSADKAASEFSKFAKIDELEMKLLKTLFAQCFADGAIYALTMH